MMNFDEIFERIKLATNTRTQMQLAEALSIRQSSISDAKRRQSIPAEWYMKLFEQFGLNPDWLKKGTGPRYLRMDAGYMAADVPQEGGSGQEGLRRDADAASALVTVYSTRPEGSTEDLPAAGKLAIPRSFASPGLCVVRLETSGMEPQMYRGAYVGIDTTQRRVASGELYGVRLPYEGLVIKRAFVDARNDTLLLRSENPSIPEARIPLDGHETVLFGRVNWVLQWM